MKSIFAKLDKRKTIALTKLPKKCNCGCEKFFLFNSYSESDSFKCEQCNQTYLVKRS